MKFVLALLAATANAQIEFCTQPSDCEGKVDEGGCCNVWEGVSWAEDSEWGQFADVWKSSSMGELAAGSWWGACMTKAYVDANAAVNADSRERNNYEDLALIKELFPDFNEFGDVDEWIDAWGSTAETQEAFIMNVYCKEASDKAMALAASAAVALSAFALI